jgi:hypothetical protein
LELESCPMPHQRRFGKDQHIVSEPETLHPSLQVSGFAPIWVCRDAPELSIEVSACL